MTFWTVRQRLKQKQVQKQFCSQAKQRHEPFRAGRPVAPDALRVRRVENPGDAPDVPRTALDVPDSPETLPRTDTLAPRDNTPRRGVLPDVGICPDEEHRSSRRVLLQLPAPDSLRAGQLRPRPAR